MNCMATSETEIKYKLLSVGEKLDIIQKTEITSNAWHKKITEKLGISLPTWNIWGTMLTQFLSEQLIYKKMKTAK